MTSRLRLSHYSFGVGDRFAHEARAQLRAFQLAAQRGVDIVPVWNKSNREHTIVGSRPGTVREAACAAVQALGWTQPWHVDADHINLATVGGFLASSDFFTIDVADYIGKPPTPGDVADFIARHPELQRTTTLPGSDVAITLSTDGVRAIADKYLFAVQEAGRIYRCIETGKGRGTFVTEVSLDETELPQAPEELLVILAALADQGVPVQTIAPKFTGRFNKGVDYVGDVQRFEAEFRADIAVIARAVVSYGLPDELKLSVHSGSDKFSIYPAIRRALADFGAGVHVKTAGTTWLEEVIGLAEHGGAGLALAAEIYAEAFAHRAELCAPYAAVIDVDPARLPDPAVVQAWSSERFVRALRHDRACSDYNPSLRQLIHVGYKVAARMGERFTDMLGTCEETIARNVTGNLYERHLRPLFLEKA